MNGLDINSLLSGGIGVIVGVIATAYYNKKENKKRLKKEIQLRTFEEIINKIMDNRRKLSAFEIFITTQSNTLSSTDFLTSFFLTKDDLISFVNNLNKVTYEFVANCEDLSWTIQKRQMVLLEDKKSVNEIDCCIKNVLDIAEELNTLLINKIASKKDINIENNDDIKEKFDVFIERKDKYYKALYSFDIELENKIFGDIFDKHIINPLTKNIK